MPKMGKKTRGVALAGLFCAITVVFQYATAPAGQLVTGALVNLTLITCGCIAGLWPGLAVGAVTPIVASLFGIGPPFMAILPFMALGNMSIVFTWHVISCSKGLPLRRVIAAVCGAIVKCAVLYLGIVRFALPYLTNANPVQTTRFTAMFSLPQLFTALIGGAVACAVLPLLEKAGQARRGRE